MTRRAFLALVVCCASVLMLAAVACSPRSEASAPAQQRTGREVSAPVQQIESEVRAILGDRALDVSATVPATRPVLIRVEAQLKPNSRVDSLDAYRLTDAALQVRPEAYVDVRLYIPDEHRRGMWTRLSYFFQRNSLWFQTASSSDNGRSVDFGPKSFARIDSSSLAAVAHGLASIPATEPYIGSIP